jgi:hypothetical protein
MKISAAPPLHEEVPKTCQKSIGTKGDNHSGMMADNHSGSMAHNHNYIYIYKGRDCMVK